MQLKMFEDNQKQMGRQKKISKAKIVIHYIVKMCYRSKATIVIHYIVKIYYRRSEWQDVTVSTSQESTGHARTSSSRHHNTSR